MSVRDYEKSDEAALRECVIQLQDAERETHPKTADGAMIARSYVEYLTDICSANRGRISWSIGVLAGNKPVRRMYENFGFDEHKIVLDKRI